MDRISGIDITSHLMRAAGSRPIWSLDRARSLAALVAARVPGASVDWDEDSGEDWARILADRDLVALVRADLALLVVIRDAEARVEPLDPDVVLVLLDDMDAPDLTASEESLVSAFPGIAMSWTPELEADSAIDLRGFSAMDLWFETT